MSADKAADAATKADDNSQYVIGAGDQLGISVYHAPELSVPSLPVRPDGRISMPLIPDIVAAGKTPTQLGNEMQDKLKEYVKDPIVTVMVTSFVGPFSRQVRVIGEATDPPGDPVSRPHDRAGRDDRGQGPDQIRRRQQGGDRARSSATSGRLSRCGCPT